MARQGVGHAARECLPALFYATGTEDLYATEVKLKERGKVRIAPAGEG